MVTAKISKVESDKLLELYKPNRNNVKRKDLDKWFKGVRDELVIWMEEDQHKRVHSVRARMKDLNHLRGKIERWHEKHAGKKLTEANFFEEIEDLAGVRILVLYRHDVAIVDHFVYRCDKWIVLKAEANYDENRYEDEHFFERDLGFSKETPKRLLQPKRGYASIHYILVPRTMSPEEAKDTHRKCELQVRTIHEEAWGEFSHEFTYPYDDEVDPLASRMIKRLSGLLHQAEDIVSDIRRSPADSRLFRRVHREIWERPRKSRLPPKITFDVIHDMLAEVQFMTRSALLAAVGILTKRRGKKAGIKFGKAIEAQELITLGFGSPKDWTDDELQKLYLEAHSSWVKSNPGSKVFKFFVWPPSNPIEPGDVPNVPVPKLFESCSGVEFLLLKPEAHDKLHEVLGDELKLGLDSGYCLSRIQFFLWRSGDVYKEASLPCREGTPPSDVFGFYGPSCDPDLLGGMLWLSDSDEDKKMRTALNAYADLLLEIKDNADLVVKLASGPASVIGALTDESKSRLKGLVEDKFKPLLSQLRLS
jgi:ppGpp synthetase/RelA/SpoT-type nucleotidyltranferase